MKDIRQEGKVPGWLHDAGLRGTAVPPSNPYIYRDRSLPPAEVNIQQVAKISCASGAVKTSSLPGHVGKEGGWNYWLKPKPCHHG